MGSRRDSLDKDDVIAEPMGRSKHWLNVELGHVTISPKQWELK
jgi:hypothetical protein